MPFLLLRLLGLGKWLREAATALLGLVRRHPLAAALIVAVALAGWQWRDNHIHTAQRDAAIAGRAADRKAYFDAQADAQLKAIAALRAQEARYTVKAKEADHDHEIQLASASAAAERFIAAGGVRRAKAASGASGGTVARAESSGAQSSDGPGAASELVAVTADDVRICTNNTVRLESVRAWVIGLNGD